MKKNPQQYQDTYLDTQIIHEVAPVGVPILPAVEHQTFAKLNEELREARPEIEKVYYHHYTKQWHVRIGGIVALRAGSLVDLLDKIFFPEDHEEGGEG